MRIVIGASIALVVFLLVTLVAVDVATTPTATRGQCLLSRRTVLPDICVNSCPSAFDCTLTTRPYAVFFTQAASCMDGVIC
jgi:hypothetical protein